MLHYMDVLAKTGEYKRMFLFLEAQLTLSYINLDVQVCRYNAIPEIEILYNGLCLLKGYFVRMSKNTVVKHFRKSDCQITLDSQDGAISSISQ